MMYKYLVSSRHSSSQTKLHKLSGIVAALGTVSRLQIYDLSHDSDPQQIASLCADLRARADAADAEQAELEKLVSATADGRLGQRQQFGAALDQVRTRGRRMRLLICRHCGRP